MEKEEGKEGEGACDWSLTLAAAALVTHTRGGSVGLAPGFCLYTSMS